MPFSIPRLPFLTVLTFAIPKGSLLKESVQLLAEVGLDFSVLLDPSNRQLQITDPTGRARAMLVRNSDVTTYVESGQAQLGVVGYDVLREKKAQVAHLVDLGFGGCRMSIAVQASSPYRSPLDLPAHARIASKFVHSARDYFDDLNLPVEIVPLYGSVELGPITGMAEAIVDLVATGRTLQENGLIEIETLFTTTARLVAHPLSYRLNTYDTAGWVAQVRSQVATSLAP